MRSSTSVQMQYGQWTLIGTLIAIAILITLAATLIPHIAASRSAPGEARTPKERAYGAGCSEYLGQISMAVTMYKADHDDHAPRSLDELKKYGVGNDILQAPGCTFQIDPSSGQVSDTSQGRLAPAAPGAPPSAAPPQPSGTIGPGGVRIPTIPGASVSDQ